MQKIRTFEERRILLADSAEVHIAEESDGVFNLSFEGNVRIGIPFRGGTCFVFLKEIVKTMQEKEDRG